MSVYISGPLQARRVAGDGHGYSCNAISKFLMDSIHSWTSGRPLGTRVADS
jgi:hypothetical protein